MAWKASRRFSFLAAYCKLTWLALRLYSPLIQHKRVSFRALEGRSHSPAYLTRLVLAYSGTLHWSIPLHLQRYHKSQEYWSMVTIRVNSARLTDIGDGTYGERRAASNALSPAQELSRLAGVAVPQLVSLPIYLTCFSDCTQIFKVPLVGLCLTEAHVVPKADAATELSMATRAPRSRARGFRSHTVVVAGKRHVLE